MSQTEFASLAETVPLSVVTKDLSGQIVYANQRYCKFIGQTRQQLIGKTNFDLFSAELARKYTKDDEQLLQEKKPIQVVEEYVQADGAVAHIQVFKSPVFDADQQLVGLVSVYKDVTEFRQTAQAFDQERYLKGDAEICLNAGMDEYLSKPIRMRELAAKLLLVFGKDASRVGVNGAAAETSNSGEAAVSPNRNGKTCNASQKSVGVNQRLIHCRRMRRWPIHRRTGGHMR